MENAQTNTQKSNMSYPIFLSSHYSELKLIREQVYVEAGHEKYIYVDEMVCDRNIENQEPLEIVDELVKRIREARTFICILGGKNYGSPVGIGRTLSSVSYFEVELFQAALLQKPVFIFVREGYSPDPREKRLMELFRFYLPEWISQKRLNDQEIVDQIHRIVANDHVTLEFRLIPHLYKPIRRLVQGLYTNQSRNSVRSGVTFLEGEFETRPQLPRPGIVQNVINMIGNETNEERRLSRLWIGLRELMNSRYDEECELELLRYWNVLLNEWAKAGAWYGLHGDIPLGCLAALNSLVDVRLQMNRQYKRIVNDTETIYPGGSLASTKYSIAKLLYVGRDRKKRFTEALFDIKTSLDHFTGNESDLRAIQASIYLQLGAMADAITEYEKVLHLRQISDASEATIGEAMSELGYGYLRVFRFRRGLSFSEEGVKLLRKGDVRAGFLARGLKKLGYAYLCNGRFLKAYDTFCEAKEVATKHGTLDQL